MRSEIRLLLLSAAVVGVVLSCLAGCPTPPQRPQLSAPAKVGTAEVGVVEPPAGSTETPLHRGRPFDVVSRESLLTILAFRGGTLAKVGHNHVIASHEVSGTFYVPQDIAHSTFELHVPVGQLVIDEPDLRTKEGPDFPPGVSDSAKEGTRRNMLSEALLNGAQYPDISLVGERIEPTAPGSQVRAAVLMTVRGQTHTVSVPVLYSLGNGELTVWGELPLRQSELGLTPFSAMLGALAVQDELRVRFRFVAHESLTKGTAGR
jgi:hypothetical protein